MKIKHLIQRIDNYIGSLGREYLSGYMNAEIDDLNRAGWGQGKIEDLKSILGVRSNPKDPGIAYRTGYLQAKYGL